MLEMILISIMKYIKTLDSDMSFSPDLYLLKRFKIQIVCTLFILFVCMFFCNLDENVIAEGMIRPLQTEITINSNFSGVITDIFYKNADYVNDGDILFVQDCSYEKEFLKNLIDLQSFYENKINSYKTLQVLLESTDLTFCDFDKNIAMKDILYSSFVNQYKYYKNDVESKKKFFEQRLLLYPNIISQQELEDSENSYIQAKLNFSTWLENQRIEILEQLSQFSQKKEDCCLEILKTKKMIDNATTKASQSGYINEITKVNKGDYINAGMQILTLIPETTELKCIINVSNSKISKIQKGQEVFIRIEDLPFTKYGKIKGRVTVVPYDAVMDDNSFYPIEVVLLSTYVKSKNIFNNNEIIMLKIGTKISAEIIVGRNTIIQKLVQELINING